jgi:hypothetical protein
LSDLSAELLPGDIAKALQLEMLCDCPRISRISGVNRTRSQVVHSAERTPVTLVRIIARVVSYQI